MPTSLTVHARSLLIANLLAVAALVVLGALRPALETIAAQAEPFAFEIERMFDLGREASVASWFGSSLFLLSALLVYAARKESAAIKSRGYACVIVVCLFLALDFATNVHERFLSLWMSLTGGEYSWVLIAICVVAFAVAYLVTGALAEGTRREFRLAALLIAAGYAWRVAAAAGWITDGDIGALLCLLGAVAFAHACLMYMAREHPLLELHFDGARRVLSALVGISLFFTLTTIIMHILNFTTDVGSYDPAGFIYLFNTGQEATFPTAFSYGVMLLCALLLWLIAAGRRRDGARYVRHWQGLAVVFVLLSIDEAVSLHEQLMQPSRALLTKLSIEADGLLYFAWIVPVGVLLLLLTAVYIPFLRHLPRRTLILFIVSAALFVGGAIGMELPGGYVTSRLGDSAGIKLALETVEELLELLGIALFAYALLDYLCLYVRSLGVRFVPHA